MNKETPLIPKQKALSNFGGLMTDLLERVVRGEVDPEQSRAACQVADVMLRALELRLKYEEERNES